MQTLDVVMKSIFETDKMYKTWPNAIIVLGGKQV